MNVDSITYLELDLVILSSDDLGSELDRFEELEILSGFFLNDCLEAFKLLFFLITGISLSGWRTYHFNFYSRTKMGFLGSFPPQK